MTPGGATDSAFFRPIGVKCYGCAPILASAQQLASMHGDNENITLDQMERGTAIVTDAAAAGRHRALGGQADREGRPVARGAGHEDLRAQQVRQLPHQRQAQAGAAVAAGVRGVGLVEGLEQRLHGVRMDADARVADLQAPGRRASRQADSVIVPSRVNLQALSARCTSTSLSRGPSVRMAPRSGASSRRSRLPPARAFGRDHGRHAPNSSATSTCSLRTRHPARHELGQLQDVVDQAQQVLPRGQDLAQVIDVARQPASWASSCMSSP